MIQSSPQNSHEIVNIDPKLLGINAVLSMYAEAANDQLFRGEFRKIGEMPKGVQLTLNQVLVNTTLVGIGNNEAVNEAFGADKLRFG